MADSSSAGSRESEGEAGHLPVPEHLGRCSVGILPEKEKNQVRCLEPFCLEPGTMRNSTDLLSK